jgi:hypothetical protein
MQMRMQNRKPFYYFILLFAFYFIFLFFSVLAQPTPSPPCVPNAKTGCLNGKSFDRKTHYVCGTLIVKNATRCCGSGDNYDPKAQFCCGHAPYPMATEKCVLFEGEEANEKQQEQQIQNNNDENNLVESQQISKRNIPIDNSENNLPPGAICRFCNFFFVLNFLFMKCVVGLEMQLLDVMMASCLNSVRNIFVMETSLNTISLGKQKKKKKQNFFDN